ncbi:hypothetical protein EVAR_52465_1 [Eumeta japonica]|uniref:Uncharacterized protein n=1 Tax=Eumeta variegata TaxID=151549 RepID=A0A4C1YZ20_EUMVA|nr:hypothetical protein EVAR_52465_1 [Eumeta japonica]
MTELAYRGYAIHSMHILHRMDGTPVGLVWWSLTKPTTVRTSNKFSKVCGLSGISVEAPYKTGRQGKYRQGDAVGNSFRPASAPSTNACRKKQPSGAAPESIKRTAHRMLPPSSSNSQVANQNTPLGDDIKMIISDLRVVKSVGFAELVSNFHRARTGEDRLAVILAHDNLLAKLESL